MLLVHALTEGDSGPTIRKDDAFKTSGEVECVARGGKSDLQEKAYVLINTYCGQ